MNFTTYFFLFLFLPGTLLGYYLLGKLKNPVWSDAFLILASLWFIYEGCGFFTIIFLASTFLNFGISKAIWKVKGNRAACLALMWTGILWNIGLLGYYKYYNFAVESVDRFFAIKLPALGLELPIGISFLTLQLIAFLIETYRQKNPDCGLREYLLFVTFFPQRIIGPITRAWEIVPQLRDKARLKPNSENICQGLFLIGFGLGKKVLIANPLIAFTQKMFDNPGDFTPVVCITALFANLFSLYFDFSGYSDMAIGIAKLFGITLPENFNSPLKARNFQDYWQRRHITLTRFLTDFIFRSIYNPARGILCFIFATFVTFLVSGFWHGAGFNYILWGLCHGLMVSVVGVISVYYPKKYLFPKPLAQIMTIAALLLVSGLFAVDRISEYGVFLSAMSDFSRYLDLGFVGTLRDISVFVRINLHPVLVTMAAFFIAFFCRNTTELWQNKKSRSGRAFFSGVVFAVSIFMMTGTSQFIYARF